MLFRWSSGFWSIPTAQGGGSVAADPMVSLTETKVTVNYAQSGQKIDIPFPKLRPALCPPLFAAPDRSGFLFRGRSFPCGLVEQLDESHRRIVAVAEAALQDAQVSSIPVDITRTQLVEKLDDHLAIPQTIERQAPVGKTRLLSQGNDRFGDPAQFLGFGQGGSDRLMAEQ
jgi:hypothetical protein